MFQGWGINRVWQFTYPNGTNDMKVDRDSRLQEVDLTVTSIEYCMSVEMITLTNPLTGVFPVQQGEI